MTFLSKTLKTKKKLFDDELLAVSAALLALFGLFVIMIFCMRLMGAKDNYGVVPLDIPIVSAPVKDPTYHGFSETPRHTLARTTPTVVLTSDAFFFGELASFSISISQIDNKYVIKHQDGQPQLRLLVEQLSDWIQAKSHQENIPIDKIVILAPTGDIPLPIVTQVVAGLRKSPFVDRVILSSGLL